MVVGVLHQLLPEVTERVHRAGVRQIVSGTRYSPARAPAAVLCAFTIDWTCPDMAGWFPYDFTAGSLYVVLSCRTNQRKTCPGSVPHVRIGPMKLEWEVCMQAATERVQREMALAAAGERSRWDRASKDRRKSANVRSDENVTVSRENVTQKAAAARSGQESSVVVIGDSVAPTLKEAAFAMAADVMSVQVTGDLESQ